MFSAAALLERAETLDRNLRNIVLACGLICLFIPKIDLIAIDQENAGIRIDDLLIAATGFVFVLATIILRRNYLSKFELLSILFIFLGLVVTSFGFGNILYSLRQVEYFWFFFVGLFAFAAGLSLLKLATIFNSFNIGLILLQVAGIVGGFPRGNYNPDAVLGIGSGSWEIGVLFNLTLAIGAFTGPGLRKPWRVLLFAVIPLCLMFFTGGRLPVAIHLLLTFAGLIFAGGIYRVWAISGAVLGTVLLPIILTNFSDTKLIERTETLTSAENFQVVESIWERCPASINTRSYNRLNTFIKDPNIEADMSLMMRAVKVCSAVKAYAQAGPFHWVFGLGPGVVGVALDAGLVRVVIENGVIGAALLLFLFACVIRLSSVAAASAITILISSLTLDSYLAYKIMAWFWFIAGYEALRYCSQKGSIPQARNVQNDWKLARQV